MIDTHPCVPLLPPNSVKALKAIRMIDNNTNNSANSSQTDSTSTHEAGTSNFFFVHRARWTILERSRDGLINKPDAPDCPYSCHDQDQQ